MSTRRGGTTTAWHGDHDRRELGLESDGFSGVRGRVGDCANEGIVAEVEFTITNIGEDSVDSTLSGRGGVMTARSGGGR